MDDAVKEADAILVAALARDDAAGFLDDDFNWIDSHGRVLTKAQAADARPSLDESGLTPSVHDYGDVATVAVGRDKIFVLRIWVKRGGAWRLLVYHEVSQAAPAAPHGPGRKEWDNPCKTIPYDAAQQRPTRLSGLLAGAGNRGDAPRTGGVGGSRRRRIHGGRRRAAP